MSVPGVTPAPTVTVIGAGIVGVCAASWLQREGFAVTLVDAGPVGEGASFGNSGNISPGAVVPYMIPGFWKEAPGWLLDPKGPLVIRPGYFLGVLPWILAAVKASRPEAAMRVSRAMHLLHRGTFDAYATLTRGTAAEALIERCGQLYVSEKEGGAQGSALVRRMREEAGVKAVALSAQEVRDLEPSLAPIFKSGLLLPDNGRCKNPHQLVNALADEAVRRGARILRARVRGFDLADGRVRALVVDGGTQPVERLVLAAGAGSRELCAALGTPLPLEAERGYHITIEDPGVMPRIPVSHRDAAFACAPMNMGLRIAGTAEFAGIDAPPDWQRAELLRAQALRMFPGVRMDKVTRWMGSRPSLPDGLPALGPAPGLSNAWFAFGNSHFGLSAGSVMGKVAAELVAGRTPSVMLEAFRAERFAK